MFSNSCGTFAKKGLSCLWYLQPVCMKQLIFDSKFCVSFVKIPVPVFGISQKGMSDASQVGADLNESFL